MTNTEAKTYDKDSVNARLSFYERRVHTTVWIGAGLAGLIVLVASGVGADLLKAAPPIFQSVIITLILVSGGAVALARANYEYAAARIKNRQHMGILRADRGKLPDELKAPKKSEVMYRLSLYAIFFAALTFIVPLWWWLIPCVQNQLDEETVRLIIFAVMMVTSLAAELWAIHLLVQ